MRVAMVPNGERRTYKLALKTMSYSLTYSELTGKRTDSLNIHKTMPITNAQVAK